MPGRMTITLGDLIALIVIFIVLVAAAKSP
jgi:hypothetical protein